jgi:ATP synthase I chain
MATPPEMRAPLVAVCVAGVVLTAGALVFGGLRTGFSTGIGASIAAINLWVLARVVGGADSARWRTVALLKMLGLFGGVWALLTYHLVDPIPLVVGLGALPIGLTTGSMLSAGRARKAP